jgi:hypothetical protein
LRRLVRGQLDVVNGHLVRRIDDRHFTVDGGAPCLLLVATDLLRRPKGDGP